MATTPSTGLRHIRRVLLHRNYRIYVAGNSVSLIGTWMQRVTVGWLTWELTGSGAWLGYVAFADLAPSVVIGPIAGALADRVDRLRIVTVSQSLAMIQAFALFGLTATGLMTPAILIALVFVHGLVIGFNQPARMALVSSLVPRADLSTAIAVNAIVFNVARFIGPACAGLLIVTLGVAASFAVNALSFLAFLLALSRVRLDPSLADPARRDRGSLLGDTRDGLRYAAKHPGLGPLLALLTVVAVGVRPYVELLPGFAADVFGRGADGLAMLSSTIGIGAVMGGLWLARRGSADGLARIALLSPLLAASSIAAFVATDVLWLALPCVALAGAFLVSNGVASQTLVQMSVATAMRGRILSLYGVIFRGGPAVGALLMGVASDWTGLRPALALGAVTAGAAWLWIWRRRKRVMLALSSDPSSRLHSGVRPPEDADDAMTPQQHRDEDPARRRHDAGQAVGIPDIHRNPT